MFPEPSTSIYSNNSSAIYFALTGSLKVSSNPLYIPYLINVVLKINIAISFNQMILSKLIN
jgi:hypothetical protein